MTQPLATMATALQAVPRLRLGSLYFTGREVWEPEQGFCYTPAIELKSRALPNLAESCTGIEFEWLEVREGIEPHYHEHSDSVVRCLHGEGNYEGYFVVGNDHFWLPLQHDQLIVVPAGTAHGFQRRQDASGAKLLLLAASCPGIAEDDVVYV